MDSNKNMCSHTAAHNLSSEALEMTNCSIGYSSNSCCQMIANCQKSLNFATIASYSKNPNFPKTASCSKNPNFPKTANYSKNPNFPKTESYRKSLNCQTAPTNRTLLTRSNCSKKTGCWKNLNYFWRNSNCSMNCCLKKTFRLL